MAEPSLCDNIDMVVDWSGGNHDTVHAVFGLRTDIDPAVYKVIVKTDTGQRPG